jgi:hypothetical protein
MDDLSRVCDLSVGGLFLATPTTPPLGGKAKLDFLVQEGQIRAEATVRHLIPNVGVGLKFTAITDQDCPNLVSLINRIRRLAQTINPKTILGVYNKPTHLPGRNFGLHDGTQRKATATWPGYGAD